MDEDIKLKLIAKKPLTFENIKIPSILLDEISEITFSKYNLYLSNLVFEPKDVIPNSKEIDVKDIQTYDIITSNLIYAKDLKYNNFILDALGFFLKNKVKFFQCKNCFYIGDIKNNCTINKENYEKFKEILKFQNCLDKEVKEEFNPANDAAEKIKQKILKAREKTMKINNDVIQFSDLVSVLASNSKNINIINIWELSIYQFNDQFSRMKMIEDYDIGIRQLLAGAKSENVNLKYYIRPIENQ